MTIVQITNTANPPKHRFDFALQTKENDFDQYEHKKLGRIYLYSTILTKFRLELIY